MQTSKLLYYPDNADTHKLITPGPFGEQPATYDGALVLWANDAGGKVYPIQSSFIRMLLALHTVVDKDKPITGPIHSTYMGASWYNTNYSTSVNVVLNGSTRSAKITRWRWALQVPLSNSVHPVMWYFEEPIVIEPKQTGMHTHNPADFYIRGLALSEQGAAMSSWQRNYWALAISFAELWGGSVNIREGLDLDGRILT